MLKSVPVQPEVTDEPVASARVLRSLGVSRKKWDTLTIEEKMARLQDRVVRDVSKTAAMKSAPSEPFHHPESDAPVIYFRKTFGNTDGPYEYAATHVAGRGWLITSQQRLGHMTWTTLLQFVMLRETDETQPAIWLATGWELLEK
jgi:hypothetical protein